MNGRAAEIFRRGADGTLRADGVSLAEAAARFGTPCYFYSRSALESAGRRAAAAFAPAEIRYAVKANSNLEILRILAGTGCGFDVVSGGELSRVLEAGGSAAATVFSGVGKSRAEIDFALRAGVGCFNAESAGEVGRIATAATESEIRGRVALRVIPDVDAATHRHLTTGLSGGKFGIPMADAMGLARRISEADRLDFAGLSCHLGSQIRDAKIFGEAARRMAALRSDLEAAKIPVAQIDMGGGFAAAYRADESACDLDACARALFSHFDPEKIRVLVEPGRALTAAAGALLTRVEYVKSTGGGEKIVITDAGMNDLPRPALYDAHHRIVPVSTAAAAAAEAEGGGGGDGLATVAGPVCESADILGRARELAAAEGDLLAILDSGAYGMAMASNYNTRCRPCEVLAESGRLRQIRRRETLDEILATERGG